MDLQQLLLEGVDCYDVAQDRDRRQTVVDALMNIRVP
jgi:hypothetical protein